MSDYIVTKLIPKIPQNNKEYFIFSTNEYFYSINIQFNHKSKINMENLFLIIRFYLDNSELLVEFILVISEDIEQISCNDNNMSIYHYIKLEKLKKMSFFEFKEWFYELKQNDYEYIVNMKYYGFRVVFNKNSIFYKEKNIYPIYPWDSKYKNSYISNNKKNIKLEKWLYKKNKFLFKLWRKEKGRLNK